MPTLPARIFLCLLFYEPMRSLSPSYRVTILRACACMLSFCQAAGRSQTPHPPCARGCKGRVGWPGWIVSNPWRCKDRRCCCCNCCICKSCCWKANCCVATCCCWGWKWKKNNKNTNLSIQSKALTEDLLVSTSTSDRSQPVSRQASQLTSPHQRPQGTLRC